MASIFKVIFVSYCTNIQWNYSC